MAAKPKLKAIRNQLGHRMGQVVSKPFAAPLKIVPLASFLLLSRSTLRNHAKSSYKPSDPNVRQPTEGRCLSP